MRRAGGLWDRVVSFGNIRRAALRAARGKRHVASVARFLADLEPEALRLQRELVDGSWRPGPAFSFEIHDPKLRTITAAPFADRVVHHALMAVLEPLFDRRMPPESYACRRGKGTHAALAQARRLVRSHAWFLKLDVRKCFESLDHGVVLATVARAVKDRHVLALCARIVEGGGRAGIGLPIGNLTSQWFANLVLDRLDRFVKQDLRVRGYVRYMDDFALFADDKAVLRRAHDDVRSFLADAMRLELKPQATILAPTREGLPFLGWRVHCGVVRIRPENLRRLRSRIRHRCREHRTGLIGDDELLASLRSTCEHLRHGNTLSLRRRLFAGWAGFTPALARSPP